MTNNNKLAEVKKIGLYQRWVLLGNIYEAMSAMKRGIPVLLHDDTARENEIDYVLHASKVTIDKIYEMRTLAGGLICYAIPYKAGEKIGLEMGYKILSLIPGLVELTKKTLRYGDKPAFSIWVNHIKVITGIRDKDRYLTIRELNRVSDLIFQGKYEEARKKFLSEFTTPGHLPILLGKNLRERRGHTELSLYLSMLSGLNPSVVIVEMLSYGDALGIEDARKIERDKGYPLVEGSDILYMVEKVEEDLYCRYNIC